MNDKVIQVWARSKVMTGCVKVWRCKSLSKSWRYKKKWCVGIRNQFKIYEKLLYLPFLLSMWPLGSDPPFSLTQSQNTQLVIQSPPDSFLNLLLSRLILLSPSCPMPLQNWHIPNDNTQNIPVFLLCLSSDSICTLSLFDSLPTSLVYPTVCDVTYSPSLLSLLITNNLYHTPSLFCLHFQTPIFSSLNYLLPGPQTHHLYVPPLHRTIFPKNLMNLST